MRSQPREGPAGACCPTARGRRTKGARARPFPGSPSPRSGDGALSGPDSRLSHFLAALTTSNKLEPPLTLARPLASCGPSVDTPRPRPTAGADVQTDAHLPTTTQRLAIRPRRPLLHVMSPFSFPLRRMHVGMLPFSSRKRAAFSVSTQTYYTASTYCCCCCCCCKRTAHSTHGDFRCLGQHARRRRDHGGGGGSWSGRPFPEPAVS